MPNTFSNGTTADATQVNANFAALVACFANSAAAGANSDITSLTGLTTPIALASGGTPVYTGGTAGGTVNAITVTASPASFALTANFKIVFVASASNTGPTTLKEATVAIKNLFRQTPAGPLAMVGGEIITGQTVEAVYDGTEFQMTSAPALGHAPGEVFDYAGAAGCPVGSVSAVGGNLVAATYPAINTVLGTTWGTSAGNVVLPDFGGRAAFGLDTSSRITVAGGNFDGSVVGHVGGQQNQTLTNAQLPSPLAAPLYDSAGLNLTGSITPIGTVSGPTGTSGGGGSGIGAGAVGLSNSYTFTGTNKTLTNPNPTGGNPHPVLSNAAIVLKCIKL